MNAKGVMKLKILGVGASGFKGLRNDFYIDFLTKSKVTANDKEDEVMEIDTGLFMPTNIVFTGANSSGKSTMLDLIAFSYNFLNKGRVLYDEYFFKNEKIELNIDFYNNGVLYKYNGRISKPNNIGSNEEVFCEITDEILKKRKYYKSYGKKNIEMDYDLVDGLESNVSDTSILYNVTKDLALSFSLNNYFSRGSFDYSMYSVEVIFKVLKDLNPSDELRRNIIGLFDNNLYDIVKNEENNLFTVTMSDETVKTMTDECISMFLSDGTKKGILLLSIATLILKTGTVLMIDEIENSFHKNLVENLIFLFADIRINTRNASLFFSTHYSEILDIFNRRDNIYVMKNEKGIFSENLYLDYNNRGELSKSKLFNSNAFGTLINYDSFIKLKRGLINEISGNARG